MKSLILVASLLASSLAMASKFELNPTQGKATEQGVKQGRIIDAGENVGTVLETFSNGKARVKFDNYSEDYVREINTLASAIRCDNDICMEDRIIDSAGNAGKVIEVFANGKALVRLDSYSSEYIRQTKQLGKGFRCFEKICQGDRIIDASNNTGTVKEIFSNGRALVAFDNYSELYVRSLESLGVSTTCRQASRCELKN
jgi:translation initiation factor IF-1